MKQYIVYNAEGKVLRYGTAPDDMVSLQAGEGEFVIEGVIDVSKQKIVNGVIVPRSAQEEEEYLLSKRRRSSPHITANMTDAELDQIVLNHFLGSVDPTLWRKENYVLLRRLFYPEQTELLDAQVKLASTDPIIKAEGQAQLDKYYQDALAVKERFPKP